MIRAALTGGISLLSIGGAHAQAIEPQQTIDTTVIAGSIEPVCSVETLSPTAVVDLETTARQPITDVRYTCNDVQGFVRTITSEHGGRLIRQDQAIPYRLSGEGAAEIGFAPIDLGASYVTTVPAFPELFSGASGELGIAITSLPPRLLAGEYSDTITIDITPN